MRIRKLLVVIFLALLGLPGVLAAQNTVVGNLTSFINGFKALIRGNSAGFAQGIVGAVPLLGLFFTIFGLTFFLSRYTIFRKGDDAQMDKYARWLSIGIALLGLGQQSVYNAVLSWSSMFLIFSFIILAVFMFLIFLNKMRSEHLIGMKGLHESTKENLEAKKTLRHMQHDFKQDEKLYKKTEKDLAALDKDLVEIERLEGDEVEQIDKLADMLRKATSAANTLDEKGLHPYVQQLSREVGTLITTINHERKYQDDIHRKTRELDRHLSYLSKDESIEKNEEKHLEHVMKKYLSKHHNLDVKDDDLKHIDKEIELTKKSGLRGSLFNIMGATKKLKGLKEGLQKELEELTKFGYQTKNDAATSVQDSIMTFQFNEANKRLYELRNMVLHERSAVKSLEDYDTKMSKLASDIEREEKHLNGLLENIVQELDTVRAVDKAELKVYDKFRDKLKDLVHSMMGTIQGLAGATHELKVQFAHEEAHPTGGMMGGSYGTKTIKEVRDQIAQSMEYAANTLLNTQLMPLYEEIKKAKKGTKSANLRDKFRHMIANDKGMLEILNVSFDAKDFKENQRLYNNLVTVKKGIEVLGHARRSAIDDLDKWDGDKGDEGSEKHELEKAKAKVKGA
jgi:hypothetical protein